MLLLGGCSTKAIKPMSEKVFDPIEQGCVCEGLTKEDLGHLILIGDKKLQTLLHDREMCISRGLLRDMY